MLSFNAGDRRILYPLQAPQQLANPANGTYDLPHSPAVSIIWINALWLLSLVLSLTSALTAILVQQWARRYTELPDIPCSSSERARVRSFLFFGTLRYKMRLVVDMVPALLHLSVFLFLVGLVVLFFTVHKTVAIVLAISVGLLGSAYIILTILPCVYRDCPYRTPMSGIIWQIWHTHTFLTAFGLQGIIKGLHAILVPYNVGDVESHRQRKLTEWLEGAESHLDEQRRRLKDGLRQTTARAALETPEIVDLKALAWFLKLPALAEKTRIQDFITNIPGDTIIQLMSTPTESGRIIFRDYLLALLRSCAPGAPVLNEDVRKQRLLVCLDAVHRIVKASSAVYGVSPSESVLRDIRTNFADMSLMRAFWADADPSIRLVSRSICALLARHLLRKYPLEQSELAWLQDVMGKPSNTIYNSLDDIARVDNMNLDSYVYGVLSQDSGDISLQEATIFMNTLAILASASSQIAFRREVLEEGISSLMKRAEEDDHLLEIVEKLRKIYKAVFHEYQIAQTDKETGTEQ
jgi:hypothetical protein